MSDITNQQILDTMTEQLGIITNHMVTKGDLTNFATKDDLTNFATKDDLKQSEANLTYRLDRIERRIISGRKINVQHHLATRKLIGDLT